MLAAEMDWYDEIEVNVRTEPPKFPLLPPILPPEMAPPPEDDPPPPILIGPLLYFSLNIPSLYTCPPTDVLRVLVTGNDTGEALLGCNIGFE